MYIFFPIKVLIVIVFFFLKGRGVVFHSVQVITKSHFVKLHQS